MARAFRPAGRRRGAMLVCLLVAACGGSPSEHGSVHTDSAGIDLVTYAGAERLLAWQVEERFTLGGKETENESFYNVGPGLVDTDAAGNIHVLDREAYRVLVFDSAGRFLRRHGAEGRGPGEFSLALAFSVTPDGVAGVFDIGKRRIVRYDPGGAVLEELPIPGTYFGGTVVASGDTLIVPVRRSGEPGTSTMALLWIVATDTTELAARTDQLGGEFLLNSCGMGFRGLPPLFTPHLVWDAAGSRVVAVNSAEYELRVYEAGRLVRIIRHNVPPVPATREAALRELGDAMQVRTEGGIRRCAPEEVVEKQGFAPVIPAVRRIAMRADGELWVQRGHVRGDPAAIDVFSPAGDYIGTLPAGTPWPIAFIGDARIVTVSTDELDVSRLVIYDVVRDGA